MDDLDTGMQVYYDQRWRVTMRFCHFLLAEPVWGVNACRPSGNEPVYCDRG
jgi:hypothetical protein